MKVTPGTLGGDIARYPSVGRFDGRTVRLADVEATLDPADWPEVEVTMPGGEVQRPWAGLAASVEADDGTPLGFF